MLKPILIGLGIAALGYCAVAAGVWSKQEALLFHPEPLPADHRFQKGSDVQEVWVDVPGARLHALHLRRQSPNGVVFFLHGNAGNLEGWFSNLDLYRGLNLDLFMVDYRGFGKSTGRIENEAQLHADVRAAWASIASRYETKPKLFLGRSLGTGLAATLAAEVQPSVTVLVAPYLSMQDMASRYYPWLPSSILRYPLHTDDVIQKIDGEVIIIHGDKDEVIPPDSSAKLASLSAKAKRILIAGAGHNDLDAFVTYQKALTQALGAADLPD